MLRQQHLFSNWWMDVLEKQSNVLWQKIYGSNGAPEPPISWQILYQLKFELSRPDAFYIMFQNDTSALATAFYFNWWRMDDLENFFLWQFFLSSRRVSTQNLRIHAECSAIWSGFWPILVPDRIKSVQNTSSQRTGLVILWSAACNPILHIFTGT